MIIQEADFSEMLTPTGLQCHKPENYTQNFHRPENFRAHN